jgi:hypothetical protein
VLSSFSAYSLLRLGGIGGLVERLWGPDHPEVSTFWDCEMNITWGVPNMGLQWSQTASAVLRGTLNHPSH